MTNLEILMNDTNFSHRIFRTRRLFGAILLFGMVCSVCLPSVAEGQGRQYAPDGKALEGYDAVAYFTEGRAVKGDSSYATRWKDVEWLFSSAKNLDAFKANPERYAPRFGGFCAYGVSQGYTVRGDPQQWTLYQGKLYVNFNAGVKRQWQERKDSYIARASTNWPRLR